MGLRVPQVTRIMRSLQKAGYPVNPGVLTVEQGVREMLELLQGKGENRG